MLAIFSFAAALAAAQAAPAATGLSPDQRAAALAGQTFAFGCLQRLDAVSSAADYANGSDDLGRKLAQDDPADAAAVKLDGNGGRGCRVRYTGPFADRKWTADLAVLARAPAAGQGGCTITSQTDMQVRAACIGTATTPPHRAELVMERSGAAPTGTVTIGLAWTPPAS